MSDEIKVDKEFDREVQKLLTQKEYKYGGLNKNTMYQMVKLYFFKDLYPISDETRKQLNTLETQKKFYDIFGNTEDVLNSICREISEGRFDEFKEICKILNVTEFDEFIKRLEEMYNREKKEVDEWNNSFDARRYADYEDVSYNLCSSDNKFRQSLKILNPYVEYVHYCIGEDLKKSQNFTNFESVPKDKSYE